MLPLTDVHALPVGTFCVQGVTTLLRGSRCGCRGHDALSDQFTARAPEVIARSVSLASARANRAVCAFAVARRRIRLRRRMPAKTDSAASEAKLRAQHERVARLAGVTRLDVERGVVAHLPESARAPRAVVTVRERGSLVGGQHARCAAKAETVSDFGFEPALGLELAFAGESPCIGSDQTRSLPLGATAHDGLSVSERPRPDALGLMRIAPDAPHSS